MHEEIEVSAVRDRDLRPILDRYDLSEKVDKGELTCESCSQTLMWENLGALLVKEGGLLLFCNLSECIEEAAKRGK
jgi:hypothetical protein